MFSSLIGLGTAFSSYTCPAVYAPIALASFAYGYGSARKSFDNHYGSTDSHDYLIDSGLVNTTLPLLLEKAFKLDLFTSNIGVAFYWMGGVIHPHYRKSFIIDRVSDMVTTPFFHYGHESTILPWLFRSFSNYNYDDNGIPAANPYSYYSVMGDLKDSYNLSYGYKKTLSPQLLFQGSKSIRTDRGILTMTMDRPNQEALIKIRSLTLFERLNELMFDTFGFYLQEKQYIDVKNEDISKSINEFYKDHYIQDTLSHFHLAEPMPAQLEDIAQSLDIYEQHQSNNDVKIITLPTGRFIINENKARNSISFNFQPYAKNEVKPEMYDCPLTWRLAQKVNVALNTRSNDSLLVDMNISRLNEVLIAAGLDKQESEGFKKSFKLKYTHQEIEKLFGIRREYIKTFNQHHQFIGPKKITQITLPNTAFGADKIAALLKLLKEESHEEIRIVSDRMTHDGGEKLLIA
ncbi:hypothetical protein EBS02_08370, partial [bacterium]|nr:hypothetical protein [bacterium]